MLRRFFIQKLFFENYSKNVLFQKIYNYFCNYNQFFLKFEIMKSNNILYKLYHFYREGFSNMTVGKTLWLIVILKLFIMFAILKTFFFPNYLKTNFATDEERANHVRQELINK